MVPASRKVPTGLCARLGRPPYRRFDLRFWRNASKAVAVQHLPFREESGDHRQKAIPRVLAFVRGRRAVGNPGASASLPLMALVHDWPQRMVGRRDRGDGNARVHARYSGTGYESLFAARRLGGCALRAADELLEFRIGVPSDDESTTRHQASGRG
jgi:hypothetical protein